MGARAAWSWTRGDAPWSPQDVHWVWILAIGAGVGFLGGMFGKGGSAIATPLLHAVGVPAFVAVAAPLPAAIPSTLVASVPYWRKHLVDPVIVGWSIAFGVPATIAGAVASKWVGGSALIRITDVVIIAIGLRTLLRPHTTTPGAVPKEPSRAALAATTLVVGLAAGLLANAGGFLLVPLYLTVLRLPIKTSLACSLVVSSALAIPGTVVHVALGHVDWRVVAVFGAASVPLAGAGSRVALRTGAAALERVYGLMLVVVGGAMLAIG